MGKNKKKGRGHFCKICGRTLANEKFSGKGHRQHICKDCWGNRNILSKLRQEQSQHDREVNRLNTAIKNGLILYTRNAEFFLFEYQKRRYITRNDFQSEIFLYQKNPSSWFVIDESMEVNQPLIDVLCKKYYEALQNSHILLYEELIYGSAEVSKSRQKHFEVIRSLNHLDI